MQTPDDRTGTAERLLDWAVFGTGAFALSTAILATAFLHLTDGMGRAAPVELAQMQLDPNG